MNIDQITCDQAYSVFSTIFKDKCTRAAFYHKHFANPFKLNQPISIYKEGNEPVGINAFLGMKLSVNRAIIPIAQSCDTAVLQSQRGKGIFTKIVTAYETNMSDAKFVIGIPNEKSYHGFMKMGWYDVTRLCTFIKLLSLFGLLFGEKENRRNNKEIRCVITSNADFNETELQQINGRVAIYKNNEYINHREKGKYSTIKFYLKNTLIAYFSFYRENKLKGHIITVIDWYFSDDGYDKEKKEIYNELKKYGSIIKIPVVNINSRDSQILKKHLFFNSTKLIRHKSGYPLVVSPKGKDYRHYIKKIDFKYVDTDLILNK